MTLCVLAGRGFAGQLYDQGGSMSRHTIDGFVHSLTPHASRRGAVRAVGVLGLASVLGQSDVQAKRRKNKKKKKCRKVQEGICAGHGYCLEVQPFRCQKPDTDPCFCQIRADPGHLGEALCTGLIQTLTPDCSACPPEQICVMMGGVCGSGGFACTIPCPDPL